MKINIYFGRCVCVCVCTCTCVFLFAIFFKKLLEDGKNEKAWVYLSLLWWLTTGANSTLACAAEASLCGFGECTAIVLTFLRLQSKGRETESGTKTQPNSDGALGQSSSKRAKVCIMKAGRK